MTRASTMVGPGTPNLTPPVSNPPSQELLRRARAGDAHALGRLFQRYLPSLHRWAHGRIPQWARNAVDTTDIVQDTVLHTLRNLRSFEPQREGALLGYLRRSLLNRIRDRFRYAARHPTQELNDTVADAGASPLDLAIDVENQRRYDDALTRLAPSDREAIVGRLELGYSYEQLALVLKKPTPGAARVAVRRALIRLSDEMRGDR
jgi:RNA polymerase sigma-70 factor (ECF subfamily)